MKYDINKSWLNDENIAKRALAIFGYNLLGYFIVLLIFFGIAFIVGIFAKMLGI